MLFDNVLELCKSKGVTIWKLEKELKFANASISKWKKSYPSADRLERVAEYFGVSTDYLLGRDNRVSVRSQMLAQIVDALPSAKQDLIQWYINMLQTE